MEDLRKLVTKVSRALRQRKYAPDFWGLVRKLEGASQPRFGYAKYPGEENVRFGQLPYLNFPSTDIAEILEGQGGLDATILTYFFGLLGVNGPMPLEFTSYIFQRSHNQYDHTWRRFLDIIHHRMLMLFYRAFAMNQQSISFDRPTDDPITDMVKSLTGLPPDLVLDKKQEAVSLSYAHHFGFMIKNRSNLEDMLRRLFKMELEVRDFITAAYDIPVDSYAVLGKPETTVLGVNLQIGRTFFSTTLKFEIWIGPIDFDTYQVLMSGLTGFNLLTRTVNHYLDRPLEYNLGFKLLSNTIPKARLGFDWTESGSDATQLGYSCWIGRPQAVILVIDASRLNRQRHRESFKAVFHGDGKQ
ncbi:MAG: type VI secretion system baseplate subunit TssG [Treponema sp.]|jgi:type VI secretion system protein ImpH|nr:type VI secretion system baseplate subunit TssG [Treponema sp.]